MDKSRKRERIKKGLYPGDPDDIPIEAPLEIFNIAGADFLDPVCICILCLMLLPKLFAPVMHLMCAEQALREKDSAEPKQRLARSKSHGIGTMAGALQKEKQAGAPPSLQKSKSDSHKALL